jgi:dephospho-CoA kinase
MPSTKLVVGLTGGIGSGKSTVAALFQARGITIIDTDQLARDVVQPQTLAYHAIVKQFGEAMLTASGDINRKALGDRVFANPAERTWLENLLHPLIRAEMAKQVADAVSPYCIVVIPLLFETTPNPLINRILVVDLDEALQKQRVVERDQLPVEKLEAILAAQVNRNTRLQGAHDVIHNDENIADLESQVANLHRLYLSLSQ